MINLIEFKAKIMSFYEKSFTQDNRAECSIMKAFDDFIKESDNVSDDLNRLIEKLFRFDFKNSNQNEIENRVKEVKSIFVHVLCKDEFITLYHTNYAKRLFEYQVKGPSVIIDAENEFIKMLKNELGFTQCKKFETMA